MPKQRARRGLAGATVADLEVELNRRRKNLGKLESRYARLAAEMTSLAAEIESLGGSAPGVRGVGGGRRRAKNTQTLVDALAGVLNGKTMSVTEVADAVQDAGYVTTSPSFRTIVNQTLINSGRFKRVGRGQYTVKG
jgi:hypothetical protein